MYSGSLFFGAGVNWVLTEVLNINHRLAWVCCLSITASISFFFLKRFVFKTNEELEISTESIKMQ
jgi:hypothetical protein